LFCPEEKGDRQLLFTLIILKPDNREKCKATAETLTIPSSLCTKVTQRRRMVEAEGHLTHLFLDGVDYLFILCSSFMKARKGARRIIEGLDLSLV